VSLDIHISGGSDSTAMAIWLHEQGIDFRMIFSDTGAELPETYWILPRIVRALGKELVIVSGGTFYQKLMGFGFMLPNKQRRWCTRELKTRPLGIVSKDAAIGICADEAHRVPDTYRPLVDAGIGKKDARKLVERYDLLNPCYKWRTSCSCFCCPFQKRFDWRALWREHPDLYALAEDWEEQSRLTSPMSRFQWSKSFRLSNLRGMDEGQVSLLPECYESEEACTICSV
jgi:hypothetical protein